VYKFKTTNLFDKELKKILKSGKDLKKAKGIINILLSGKSLARKYKDHKLKGNFKGRRECHIEPDWLLIYTKEKNAIIFERTGSHSELFN
jgi:mRNA interferase YafQ